MFNFLAETYDINSKANQLYANIHTFIHTTCTY